MASSSASARAIVRDGTAASPLLGPLLDEWPDVFQRRCLKKWLDSTDCALLARACWKCGEAVASAAGLACAEDGAVVPLAPLKIVDFLGSAKLLAWAWANRCPLETRVCSIAGREGAWRGAAVGAGARLPVGLERASRVARGVGRTECPSTRKGRLILTLSFELGWQPHTTGGAQEGGVSLPPPPPRTSRSQASAPPGDAEDRAARFKAWVQARAGQSFR